MIYFDNASTTKMAEEVIEKVNYAFENAWANPSSLHRLGFNVEKEVKAARQDISNSLGISSKNLFFVPSGTIANNAVLNSIAKAGNTQGKNILVSEVEHASIYYACKQVNLEVRFVKVDEFGFIDREDLLAKLDKNTLLVSIIHVNNELGTINDINELAGMVKSKYPKVLFHSDGVQAFKKIEISLKNIDFYTVSSHKIHGIKGISALYIKDPKTFNPLYHGGGQESNLFSSTENVPGILGFAEAVKLDNNYKKVEEINVFLRQELANIKGCKINSPEKMVSPYILNVCFNKIGAEILLHYLEMDEIYISTGSACSKDKGSRVIEAIGLDKEFNNGCIRISLSRYSTMDEAKTFIQQLNEKLETIRGILG